MLAEVPSDKEFKIFRHVWNTLDNKPFIDENILMLSVAREFKTTVREIDDVLIKVMSYKEVNGKVIRKRAEESINRTIKGVVSEIYYESVSDTISVKLVAPFGWTEKMIKERIRKDLILALREAFGASETVRRVHVGVFLPLSEDLRQKLAYIEMDSGRFEKLLHDGFSDTGIEKLEEIGVWFHKCMK